MPSDDRPALSAAPACARMCWCDAYNIYIELPTKEGSPYIAKFPRSEGGLGKALAILAAAFESEMPPGGTYSLLAHSAIKKLKPEATTAQRETAHSVLKKLGMI